MDERKRHAIEHFFIDTHSSWCNLSGPNTTYSELQKDSAALLKERRRINQTMLIDNRLGKDGISRMSPFWTVSQSLALAVGMSQNSLNAARKNANEALKNYLLLKKNIKDGKTLWCKNSKDILKSYKIKWVACSNLVKTRKHELWQAHLKYTRFQEWYTATNELIVSLQNENDMLKKQLNN